MHLLRQDTYPALQIGIEYVYQEMFFVRGGLVAQIPKTDVGLNGALRAGFGLRLWKTLELDYAYQGSGFLYSDPHRIDLTYGF